MTMAVRLARKRPLAAVAAVILAIIAVAAVAAPVIIHASPNAIAMGQRLKGPSFQHPFGTDNFGRDLLSRVVYGGQVSLAIGLLVMVLTTALGSLAGLVSGYYAKVDHILMRLLDGLMAFPAILLAIAMMAALGAGMRNEIIALTIVYFPRTARVVRASTLQLRSRPFVEAAVSLGAGDVTILFRHIFLNATTPLTVQSTFIFAEAILADAALSFLGLGVKPPTPTWGNILGDGHIYLAQAPWYTLFPGLAIMVSVLCLNVLGDALRDAIDPRLTRGR